MDRLGHNRLASRTVKLTILLILAWTFVALVGRSRGEHPNADRNPFVTIVLVSCLLSGVVLTIAVPIMGVMSIAKGSVSGILAAGVAILIGGVTIVVSIWYIFPYGFGK